MTVSLGLASVLKDTSPNVVVIVQDLIDDRETSVLRHLDRPQTHLVARPDPRDLNASRTAMNENTVSPQESRDLEESATCLFETNVEGVLKETHDMRMTVRHHILMIVKHLSADIQTRLEKLVVLKTGIPIPTILPVATGDQYHQLLDQDHEEGLGSFDTRILNRTQKTIITQLVLQEQEQGLLPLLVDDVHVLREGTGVGGIMNSLQLVAVHPWLRKLAAPRLGVAAPCRLLRRTRLPHGGRTLWCRLAHVLLSLLVPKQR
jgi:hypothetical protein